MEARYYDYVVLGSGIAGLTFALQAAVRGRIAVVCKGALSDTNTAYAQGGIAAVLDAADSFEQHVQDTLAAGAGLNEAAAVRFMVERAPQAIAWLQQLGVTFDATADQSLALGLEGGHSHRRIVHVKDHTGRQIQQVLGQAVRRHANITLLEQHMGLELIVAGPAYRRRCQGVQLLHTATGRLSQLLAQAVVLATGGSGQVYRHTTNPAVATGDGLAMACRAGAAIRHMEFFQFHPTALYAPQAPDTFLVSEALRGAGAELVLPQGERFMQQEHPQGSLAPRDVVARAVYRQMRRLASPCLYLDARHLPAGLMQQHFPLIHARCRSIGIDPAAELIPVVPAAHYQCGGVVTDTFGRTSVAGLYAAGEVACTGVHGANRLASNSLLEGVILAQSAAAHARAACQHKIIYTQPAGSAFRALGGQTDGTETDKIRRQLRQLMWEKAGIERSPDQLLQAQRQVKAFRQQLKCLPASGQAFELHNLLTVAGLIISACLARKESIGGHYLAAAEKQGRSRDFLVSL